MSKLISPFKAPSSRQKLASRCRTIPLPSYRDQHRRDSGWPANQVFGSSAATAGGEWRYNWTSRSRTYAKGST